jgi:hypothetical protein
VGMGATWIVRPTRSTDSLSLGLTPKGSRTSSGTAIGKVFVAIATVSVVLRIASVIWPQYQYPIADAWMAALSMLAMTWLAITYTLAPNHINAHRIANGVGAYLLLGNSATFEALIGALYPAVFLGWVVSNTRPDMDHRD